MNPFAMSLNHMPHGRTQANLFESLDMKGFFAVCLELFTSEDILCDVVGHASLLPSHIPKGVREVQTLHPFQDITMGRPLFGWRFISKYTFCN